MAKRGELLPLIRQYSPKRTCLQARCAEVKVVCELVYPGAPAVKHETIEEFLTETLTEELTTRSE